MKIDELVLSLVLDDAGLKKGQAATEAALVAIRAESEKTDESMRAGAKKNADAQKKQGEAIAKNSKLTEQADKKTQDGARNNAHSYGKWLASIISIGTAMVALNKFKNFVIDLTNSDAAAGRMAENIGMATQDLTALQGTVDKLGGSSDGLTADLFKMSQAIVALRAGGELPDWLTDPKGFFKLGGDMLPTLLDESVPMLEKFMMLKERAQKVSKPVAQYSLGKVGFQVGTITAMTNTDFDKRYKQQYALNVVNEKDSKLAQKRQIAWKMVQDRRESLGRIIVTRLSPLFLKLTNDFVAFLSKKENVEAFTRAINSFVSAIEHIDGKSLAQIFKDVGEIASAVGGVIAVAAKGISQIVDLSMGNTAVDRGFLGNMANILDGIVASIKFIISGYKLIADLVTPTDGQPGPSNGYNASGGERTATKATLDTVNGVLFDAMSVVLNSLGMLIPGQPFKAVDVGSSWRGMSNGAAAPSAAQRTAAGGGGVTNNYYNSGNTNTTASVTVKSPDQAGRAVRSFNAPNKFAPANGMQ